MRLLAKENVRWQDVTVRDRRYLNNIVEQDHRAIKRRCASMWGLKSFRTKAITLAGIELAHSIHKRQFSVFSGGDAAITSRKQLWDRVIAGAEPPTCGAENQLLRAPPPNAPEPIHHRTNMRSRRTPSQPSDVRPAWQARKV